MNQNKIRRIKNMNKMGIRIRITESQTHCIKIIRIIWMTRIIRIKTIIKKTHKIMELKKHKQY